MAKSATVTETPQIDHTQALADAVARTMALQDQMAQMFALLASKPGLTAVELADALEVNRKKQFVNVWDSHIASCFEPADADGKKIPKASFVREVYSNNHREDESQCTPTEVDAYNVLSASLTPGSARTTRGGRYVARVNPEGTRLSIFFPCKNEDDRYDVPTIIALCRELTDGVKDVTHEDLLARMLRLEQDNAALKLAMSATAEAVPA